jgi:hypothetical protein
MGKRATGIDELVKQAADNPDAAMTPVRTGIFNKAGALNGFFVANTR